MKRTLAALAILATGCLFTGGQALAQASEFTEPQVEAIGQIVRDYLVEHPEVLREVFTALEEKEERERKDKLVSVIDQHGSDIFNSATDIVLGNPDGNVTMVEFFDYNCGYCKRALTDMTALIEFDADLRVVLKEFPILTPGSVESAKVSIAVAKHGSSDAYLDFHSKLLNSRGANDGARALAIAEAIGLDMDKIKAEMAAPETDKVIEKNQELATLLGVDGTPAYVIGRQLVPGAVGVDGLRDAIAAARGAQ